MWLFGPTVATLHWPQNTADLGLCLNSTQVTGRSVEKRFASHLRPRRPLVHSSFPASIGHEIRQGFQFLHGLFRSLGHLPGVLARFIPCQPSAHCTRLLHVGWGQCGHGLSSRPSESCDIQVLQPLRTREEQLQSLKVALASPVTPLSPSPKGFHLGRCLFLQTEHR